MADYAQIDENNIVIKTIAATRKFINSGAVGNPASWLECSKSGEAGSRRYPGIGYFYDPETDNFYPPKPEENPSFIWTIDERTGLEGWLPPVPYPGRSDQGQHLLWDEETLQWIENTDPTTWVNPHGPVRYDPELGRMVDDI